MLKVVAIENYLLNKSFMSRVEIKNILKPDSVCYHLLQ